MKNIKISVIGAGNVGATCAQLILQKNLGQVSLIDIQEGLAAGKALDLVESAPVEGFSFGISGGTDMVLAKDSDIVVITAGLARKPGMSRSDLLETNSKIIQNICKEIARLSPEAIIIIVTNPLDIMTYVALKTTGFAEQKVMGMAGVLDTARFRVFIAQALNVYPTDVQTMVLGGHGDSMVPLVDQTTVSGIPLSSLMESKQIEAIVDRTRKGGAEIVGLLKTGSAFYAPAASVVQMVKAIINDEKRIIPVAAYLNGQYGLKDLFLGVPAKIGAGGVEEIIEVKLNDSDSAALKNSAKSIKKDIAELKL
ncbi:MAG: malate dehydrogenase [Candidatus Omnitrophica bacterium]|nr:malate dehydrogenase [Candidatus Omnitrophota bacterium]